MTKILWLSRHAMTADQLNGLKFLGDINVTQVNGTFPNVHVRFTASDPEQGETEANVILNGEVAPVKELIKDHDVIAIVAPIHLQQQVLGVSDGKPVIMALSNRVIEDGGKVSFVFDKWERLLKIEVLKEDFTSL